jgi:hypothetical protein
MSNAYYFLMQTQTQTKIENICEKVLFLLVGSEHFLIWIQALLSLQGRRFFFFYMHFEFVPILGYLNNTPINIWVFSHFSPLAFYYLAWMTNISKWSAQGLNG